MRNLGASDLLNPGVRLSFHVHGLCVWSAENFAFSRLTVESAGPGSSKPWDALVTVKLNSAATGAQILADAQNELNRISNTFRCIGVSLDGPISVLGEGELVQIESGAGAAMSTVGIVAIAVIAVVALAFYKDIRGVIA